ncbi:T-cell immunoglobulin and mucin domain-containing protein 4-like [Cygnus atratus]|uniref:T-cell immunoglobulin and mucin domain-containing protein 4-like n=1 Tax=Cygnus atratus TaxID=8868 RepID=UPI0015D599BE|nr:T-cell immunoglobulin and mucin domain-containing protein 4-like [Cygnus atratus]
MFHFVLFRWIMIQIFIVHTTSETVVRGIVGQPVRLPCFYQVAREKDVSDMCWGRGPCPNSKCNNKILHTTGNRVTFRKSQRYNLQGYISYGDVSLMIQEVRGEDAGTYCCRIEIPGWFNDIKQNIKLVVARVFDVTPSETFPEAMVTNSALPDFSTGFQAADVRTEDDDVFCSTEPIPLPEAITLPVPTALQTQETTLGPSETSASSDSNPQKVDVKLPLSISVILSVTLLAVSILLISMLTSLFWKRKHTRKFILKSLRPAEDLEKVFSGVEGENNMFVL